MSDAGLRSSLLPRRAVAALPPLLLGLALSLLILAYVPPSQIVAGAATPVRLYRAAPAIVPATAVIVCVAIVAMGALWGVRRGLPAWSHTWTTAGVVLVAFGLMIAGDDREYVFSAAGDQLAAAALFAALVALAVVAARRSWPEAALVGVGFASSFSLAVFFTSTAGPMLRADIAVLAAPAGLVFAILTAMFYGGGWGSSGATLLGVAVTALALIGVYAAAVDRVLGAAISFSFLRILLGNVALGFVAPLALAWWFGRRRVMGVVAG